MAGSGLDRVSQEVSEEQALWFPKSDQHDIHLETSQHVTVQAFLSFSRWLAKLTGSGGPGFD
jgi:hypothetical protein